MAMVPHDQKLRRPLMLKDYLRDDLSSCSSNDFKSFPRRQCCTTVRFLLENDLKTRVSNNTNATKSLLQRSRSKAAASTTISALQRASVAVLKAVKRLPFPSVVKSPTPSRGRKALLPRSFSRKLLKRSFWRKADHHYQQQHAIKPLNLSGGDQEQQAASDENKRLQVPTTTTTTTTTAVGSTSNSWSESDFTENTSSGNCESSSENDSVEKSPVRLSTGVGVSVGDDSINCSDNITKDWGNKEEKEQCSPVSVLDCPFEDEDEDEDDDDDDENDITSPCHQRLARMQGTKQKLMQKLRRYERLARLEAVDLEKQFDESNKENETQKKAVVLLQQIKTPTPPSSNIMLITSSKEDNLICDFFREMIQENDKNNTIDMDVLIKAAEDWINGKSEQVMVGWEVEGGRKGYVREMERNGRWRNVDEEKQELVLALESELFTSLVNDFVFDLL